MQKGDEASIASTVKLFHHHKSSRKGSHNADRKTKKKKGLLFQIVHRILVMSIFGRFHRGDEEDEPDRALSPMSAKEVALRGENERLKELLAGKDETIRLVTQAKTEMAQASEREFQLTRQLVQKYEDEKCELVQKHKEEKLEFVQKHKEEKCELFQKHKEEKRELVQKHKEEKRELVQKHKEGKRELVQKHKEEKQELIQARDQLVEQHLENTVLLKEVLYTQKQAMKTQDLLVQSLIQSKGFHPYGYGHEYQGSTVKSNEVAAFTRLVEQFGEEPSEHPSEILSQDMKKDKVSSECRRASQPPSQATPRVPQVAGNRGDESLDQSYPSNRPLSLTSSLSEEEDVATPGDGGKYRARTRRRR